MSRIRHDYPALLAGVSEIDFARLAAFIDGEGTIYINEPPRPYGRSARPQHHLQLMVSNTDPRLMNWLKGTFDGCVYHIRNLKQPNPLAKRKVMHWQVNERLAFYLLEKILPYMIIKRQQAEVAMAFMKLKKTRAEATKRLTDDEFLMRHGLKMEIQRLNKEGYLETPLVQ
jgi:hypothetical protein